MINVIHNVLSNEQLSAVYSHLSSAVYAPGKDTAAPAIAHLKHNLQATGPVVAEAAQTVMPAVYNNMEVQQCAFPKTLNTPIFSMYTQGMGYGAHTDDAIMRNGRGLIRTDFACTLFLNSPEEYVGGELCINVGSPNESWHKLPAGSLVIYPANTLHCVRPIEQGFRQAMVTWGQSFIQCPEKRQILHELLKAKETPNAEQINNLYTKLVRMWADV